MPISPAAPIRVLLADDHAVVRAGIRQFLERTPGVQVIAEAGDGLTAQTLIAQHQPDVVVLDIQMPGASGIEVTRWVRARYPRMGVLILTAYDEDPYILAVLRAGANGFVLKTAAPAEIGQAVREIAQGRAILDPTIAQKLLTRLNPPPETTPIESLTPREHEILTLAGKGYTNKAIGVQLGISDRTVQGHLAKIFQKLQVASRTEAVMRAVGLGWLPADLAAWQED